MYGYGSPFGGQGTRRDAIGAPRGLTTATLALCTSTRLHTPYIRAARVAWPKYMRILVHVWILDLVAMGLTPCPVVVSSMLVRLWVHLVPYYSSDKK